MFITEKTEQSIQKTKDGKFITRNYTIKKFLGIPYKKLTWTGTEYWITNEIWRKRTGVDTDAMRTKKDQPLNATKNSSQNPQ